MGFPGISFGARWSNQRVFAKSVAPQNCSDCTCIYDSILYNARKFADDYLLLSLSANVIPDGDATLTLPCRNAFEDESVNFLLLNRGIGRVLIASAGNSGKNVDVALDSVANFRMTVSVQEVTPYGRPTSRSQQGSQILISAPTSLCQPCRSRDCTAGCLKTYATKTTDLMGYDGYSIDNYTLSFVGTSGAAPIVSGIFNMVMQYKIEPIGFVDALGILIESAVRPSDRKYSSFVKNAAGFEYDPFLGFGYVHASKALMTATNWTTISEFNFTVSPVSMISSIDTFLLRLHSHTAQVRVCFNATANNGTNTNVALWLKSPSGTRSRLLMPFVYEEHFRGTFTNFCIKSFQFWKESPAGTWELVSETVVGGVPNLAVTSWTLEVTYFAKPRSAVWSTSGDGLAVLRCATTSSTSSRMLSLPLAGDTIVVCSNGSTFLPLTGSFLTSVSSYLHLAYFHGRILFQPCSTRACVLNNCLELPRWFSTQFRLCRPASGSFHCPWADLLGIYRHLLSARVATATRDAPTGMPPLI
jgi:hypothetical protein